MKKRTIVLISLLVIVKFGIAQVGPFTNNTLNTASAETIDNKSLDMQLAPEYYISKKVFDNNGKSLSLDTGIIESGLSLQFNSGITEKLEWGIAFPIDVSELSLGLKLNVANLNDKVLIAVAGWTDIPTSSRDDLIKNDKNPDNISLAGLGVVFQYRILDNMNAYVDFYGQKYFKEVEPKHQANVYLNVDFDYKITNRLRTAIGFALQNSSYDDSNENNNLGTMSYGLFFEKWENWSIYFAHYFDVMGKNNYAGNSFTFNITRSF